ncbi:Zinc metalloproteinase nas-39 [Orchesella cincta]|uniref:Zinc metalloproteinase nas-39 n=1 Tax=Orchesella cincta TaxID=48709 RepID=A0A1D2MMA9_ORCCI|nr:Zinc metalloproteinase nas-39 [Orchesella cincta]
MLSIKLLFLVFFATIQSSFSSAQAEFSESKESPYYNLNLIENEDISPNNCAFSTVCGEILNSTGGVISYRVFQNLVPNERCVWIIRGGNPSGYNIHVREVGFSRNNYDTQITATCFSKGSQPFHRDISEPDLHSVSSCDVLMITFHSSDYVGGYTGFMLEYNVQLIGGGNSVSRNSTDFILDRDFSVLHHPNASALYSNDEVSLFVFVPSNNIFSPNKKTNLLFMEESLEACCDLVNLFVFMGNSNNQIKWEWQETLLGNRTIVSNSDLAVLEFTTDSSVVRSGFQLVLAREGNECEH